MPKQFSTYLQAKLPLLEKLLAKLAERYAYCSILGCDSQGKSIAVLTNSTIINDNPFAERGFVIRVHNGLNYAEYSFNELSEENIATILKKVATELELSEEYKQSKAIKLEEYKLFEEEKIRQDFKRVYQGEKPPLATVVNRLSAVKDHLQKRENVLNATVNYQQLDISKCFLSKDKHLTQFYSWAVGVVAALVKKEEDVRYSYVSSSGVEPNQVLKELDDLEAKAYQDAMDLLGSLPPQAGVYDIIACPDITGIIAHEASGHGVEMAMFVKGRAKGQEYLNKRVASDLVTMHEGAKGEQLQVSSYFFDDEGNLAQDTIEISKGILKTGVSDALSALILGTKPTGNGKRQSFERKAYARMTATYFEAGKHSLEEMIASIKEGFLISVGYSGMEDPKNWGIQLAALIGREIKDGKLTGKVVSPIMMTGYVPDLLGSISMLSDSVELFGSGMCGKGYKEWVKVSDGGPYLKARVNIG
ncbi:TldD/PmbA family protein [bacterium]|nr:TldD/PmbA family protein [bacterium]